MSYTGFNSGARFFFEPDEQHAIAALVARQFPDETAEVLRKADETVRQRFIFDSRWDLESTFSPVDFSGPIDWLYKPSDDPEWTYCLNRMRYWICLGQAYAVTGKETYVRTFISQLVSWVTNVKRSDPVCAPAWRTIEAGFRLEYWIKAWQYFRNSVAFDTDIQALFLESIREHAEYIVSSYNSFNVISNWGVLASHGLFMAGLLLEDGDAYRSTALDRLEQEIKTQVYGDGMQWEQSPMYHIEVLHDFLDVLVLADRNHIPVSNTIRRKTHDMCLAAQYFQKPDHHEPMMGDSDDLDISCTIARGAYVFKDPEIKAAATPVFDFDAVWDTGLHAAREYETVSTREPEKMSAFFAESGNVFFRTGWQKDSTYLHFHCGTLGAGHGHSDQLHVDVWADGEDILCDSGRFTYVSKPERYAFKNAEAHNTVTVDGVSYCRWKDSWTASSFCRPLNQKFVITPEYEYCEGAHTGYLQLENGGVLVNRRILFIKPDIILFCDEFFDASGFAQQEKEPHLFRQFFHFSDTGSVHRLDPRTFAFTGKRTAAVLEGASTDSAYGTELIRTRISRHYNQIRENDTVSADVRKKGFTCMAACLFLHTGTGLQLENVGIRNIPVYSTVPGAQNAPVFASEKIQAWNISKDDRRYTVVIAHTEFAAPTDMFSADGCTGFANVAVYNRTTGKEAILLR